MPAAQLVLHPSRVSGLFLSGTRHRPLKLGQRIQLRPEPEPEPVTEPEPEPEPAAEPQAEPQPEPEPQAEQEAEPEAAPEPEPEPELQPQPAESSSDEEGLTFEPEDYQQVPCRLSAGCKRAGLTQLPWTQLSAGPAKFSNVSGRKNTRSNVTLSELVSMWCLGQHSGAAR